MATKDTKEVYLVFKPEDDNQIVWPCTISVPLSGGGFQDQILKARFKVLAKDRMEYFYPTQAGILALLEKAASDLAAAANADATGEAAEPPAPARRGDDGLLDEALIGLVAVKGAEAMSEAEIAAKLRTTQYISDGLVRGYHEMNGRRISKN